MTTPSDIWQKRVLTADDSKRFVEWRRQSFSWSQAENGDDYTGAIYSYHGPIFLGVVERPKSDKLPGSLVTAVPYSIFGENIR
jgi:hypothetical protein